MGRTKAKTEDGDPIKKIRQQREGVISFLSSYAPQPLVSDGNSEVQAAFPRHVIISLAL